MNLKVLEYLIPHEGVYATRTRIGQSIYKSVSFVGTRHSTDGEFSVETHIIDEHIAEVQGSVELFFVEFLRDNQKFNSLADLKQQIEKDIKEAKKQLGTCRIYLNDFL